MPSLKVAGTVTFFYLIDHASKEKRRCCNVNKKEQSKYTWRLFV